MVHGDTLPTTVLRNRTKTGKRGSSGEQRLVSDSDVMPVILRAKGPIVNTQVVRVSARSLRALKGNQFISAALQLQRLNLGSIITLKNLKGHQTSEFFVKRPPSEVCGILGSRPELCDVEYYQERYFMPISPAIPETTRNRLIRLGVVPSNLF